MRTSIELLLVATTLVSATDVFAGVTTNDWNTLAQGLRIKPVRLQFASDTTNAPSVTSVARERDAMEFAVRCTGLPLIGAFDPIRAADLPAFPDTNTPVMAFMCAEQELVLSVAETNVLFNYVRSGGMLVAYQCHEHTVRKLFRLHFLTGPEEDDPLFVTPCHVHPNLIPPPIVFGPVVYELVSGVKLQPGLRWAIIVLPASYSRRWCNNERIKSAEDIDAMFFVNLLYSAIERHKELPKTVRHRLDFSDETRPQDGCTDDVVPMESGQTNVLDRSLSPIEREMTAVSNLPPKEAADMMDRQADTLRRIMDRKDGKFQ